MFTVGTSAHDRGTGGSDQRIYIDDIASSDGFGTGALVVVTGLLGYVLAIALANKRC